MNRRTFTKYLLATPIALATLLTSHLTASLSPVKEKDEELGQKEESWEKQCPCCQTHKIKQVRFYPIEDKPDYCECPKCNILWQEYNGRLVLISNRPFFHDELNLDTGAVELGQKEEKKLQRTWLRISGGD